MNTEYSRIVQKGSTQPGLTPSVNTNSLDATWQTNDIMPREFFYNIEDNRLWIGGATQSQEISLGGGGGGSSYTISSGLTESNGILKLGDITENTTIQTNNNNLTFNEVGYLQYTDLGGIGIEMYGNEVWFNSGSGLAVSPFSFVVSTNYNATIRGIHLDTDHSTGWNATTPDRILATKGYVDRQHSYTDWGNQTGSQYKNISDNGIFEATLTGNYLFGIISPKKGSGKFIFKQDGTGGHTLTFQGSNIRTTGGISGASISPAANSYNVIDYVSDGIDILITNISTNLVSI